ncbi:hypothetical protein TREMEDRAFT_64418 [Tremella mesenterica DSM 1558]|uniref:uncharacterized protein n=1 Tax=Tremella mesenterica (strain ATCC 24925 / CBS 8224 / DSM 1558 / NBRC 9311 / NRRL Y-6157 / RJB 2259-6 / UBC 559-6) TaxID=578456 RepID=UPI0003F4A30D|nr:uncharacterized protein TREMEDRAFT_64418 [Tremella mesenterica DSM 1558]EIW67179.1 hypothetical protein TREMEDRAFT_64418 [Tremella mesenterica DSM 1558]
MSRHSNEISLNDTGAQEESPQHNPLPSASPSSPHRSDSSGISEMIFGADPAAGDDGETHAQAGRTSLDLLENLLTALTAELMKKAKGIARSIGLHLRDLMDPTELMEQSLSLADEVLLQIYYTAKGHTQSESTEHTTEKSEALQDHSNPSAPAGNISFNLLTELLLSLKANSENTASSIARWIGERTRQLVENTTKGESGNRTPYRPINDEVLMIIFEFANQPNLGALGEGSWLGEGSPPTNPLPEIGQDGQKYDGFRFGGDPHTSCLNRREAIDATDDSSVSYTEN